MTSMCPSEPRPPSRQRCDSVVKDCPECAPLVARQRVACRSVFEWDGQGDPPTCTEECVAALLAFAALPNVKDLTCCDCGEGIPGMICRMTRMKFEAACGKSGIECDDTSNEVGWTPISEHRLTTCKVCVYMYMPLSFCIACNGCRCVRADQDPTML